MTKTDPSDSTWRAVYNAQLQLIPSGAALKILIAYKPTITAMSRFNARDDEYDVDFENTRDHAVVRWKEIVLGACESLSSPADRHTVQEPRDWEAVAEDIKEKAMDPIYSTQMRRTLLGIQLLPQTLYNLSSTFTLALTPHTIELNVLWGLLFLNIKVSWNRSMETVPL
jgi:hypothetical protein